MKKLLLTLLITLGLTGCASNIFLDYNKPKSMPAVDYVDLDQFMGDWYVIATIPTFLERDAYNPIETYQLNSDGTIATTFTFNQGSLNGPIKIYNPRGFIKDKSTNAIWGMQFFWPIKADYRIVYLDDNYQQTIIGRNSRDFVWVMARTPFVSEEDYLYLITQVGALGYNLENLQKAIHK